MADSDDSTTGSSGTNSTIGTGGASGYRSGVAARLAGLPVETLRVWERRYGVSDAGRSPREIGRAHV